MIILYAFDTGMSARYEWKNCLSVLAQGNIPFWIWETIN
jgi:hypothetical protein